MSNYEIITFKTLGDERGSLIAIEQGYNAPFEIKRVYYIFDIKKGVERGFHADINLKQIAIVVKGSCTFIIDDGKTREEIKIDNPNQGLFIEGLIWREMKNFSEDCVLVVLASEHDEKLIPTIIRKALAGESIPIYGDGKNIRDWLYVLDHCKGLI